MTSAGSQLAPHITTQFNGARTAFHRRVPVSLLAGWCMPDFCHGEALFWFANASRADLAHWIELSRSYPPLREPRTTAPAAEPATAEPSLPGPVSAEPAASEAASIVAAEAAAAAAAAAVAKNAAEA